jgi:hypothetical protein
MTRYLSLAFLAVALFAESARADGLIYQLPEDGASVTFDSTEVLNGVEKHQKNSLVISSVGKAVVDDEKCRWIEITAIDDNVGASDPETFLVFKLLIPERHLGKGKSARNHVLRGWLKNGKKGIFEINDPKSIKTGIDLFYPPLPKLLSGPPSGEQEELANVEIDGTLGKISCAGVSGTYYERGQGGGQRIEFRTTFENRLHEKAPFGVVSSAWKVTANVGGKIREFTSNYTLTGTGENAVSKLPDKN